MNPDDIIFQNKLDIIEVQNTFRVNRKFFCYGHLPPHLQEISKIFADIITRMDKDLPDSLEKEAGVRKLLEAKDCFVRCFVERDHQKSLQSNQESL